MTVNNVNYTHKIAVWRILLVPLTLILGLSLLYFYILMQPPASDLGLMTLLLSTTAVISAAAGFTVYKLGWISYSPALRWTLVGGYLISSILTFLNVWVTAQLMFADEHDLRLASVLLLFATSIAFVIGHFLSSTIVDRINKLQKIAVNVSEGDFTHRTDIPGRDEIANLAKSLNTMAEKLELAEKQQREMEKLHRDLIAWVSHDLQTPLTSIRAMVEALSDGIIDDHKTANRYFNAIQREVDSLSSLIDDLFQMAQMDAGGITLEIETNSLSDLISDTLETFTELASRHKVEITGHVKDDIQSIRFDAQQIGRVLNNLLVNALHFTPPNGTVQVSAEMDQKFVKVTVSDSGPGISHDDLPYIFNRFYRGEKSRNRETGGAGLGLAIAKGIVEAHGGSISANSIVGKGTKITFTLPL
jgi:signal transduction histidine kinase